MNKKVEEEKVKGGKAELEGEKERVAVLCERACCKFLSCVEWEGS